MISVKKTKTATRNSPISDAQAQIIVNYALNAVRDSGYIDLSSAREALIDATEIAESHQKVMWRKARAHEAIIKLQKRFDEICTNTNVWQGIGPAMAYFQTPEIEGVTPTRYIYASYSMGGECHQGAVMPSANTPSEVIDASVDFFRGWLQPGRTLVWRSKPEIDVSSEGRWCSYWRCVQLEDGARQIIINWNF